MHAKKRLIPLIMALGFVLAGCSLASEPIPAGPIQTGPLPGEIPQTPVSQPILAEGEAIFTERCMACHGEAGDGDSEMAATLAEQGAMLPDFSDFTTLRARSPQELYQVITNGTVNTGGLMPPWRQALSNEQRWSAAYYIYSLNAGEETLARGEELTTEAITACLQDATELETNATLSPAAIITQYLRDTSACPAAEDLTESDLEAIALYAMLLPTDTDTTVAETTTEETDVTEGETAAETEVTETTETNLDDVVVESEGTVSGTITWASNGEAFTEPIEVTLQGVTVESNSSISDVVTTTTTTDEQGNYRFEDMPFSMLGLAYVVTVNYDGVEFSNGAIIAIGETSLTLPITIYPKSSDTSGISIANLHTFIEEGNGTYILTQFYVFNNNAETIPQTESPIVSDIYGTVAIPLPEGASGLQFQDGSLGTRFVLDGNTVYDTQNVLPGEQTHNIIMRYEVPAEGDITFPALYPIEATTILVPSGLNLQGNDYRSQGEQQMGDLTVDVYAANGIDAGQNFTIAIQKQLLPDINWLQIGLIVLAAAFFAMAIIGGIQAFQERRTLSALSPEHALVKQIADLDILYEQGGLNRIEYETRRTLLKLDLLQEPAK